MSDSIDRAAVLALIKTRQNSHRINNAAGKKIEDRFWHATLAIECGEISEKVRALPATDTAECERLRAALEAAKKDLTEFGVVTSQSRTGGLILAALKDQGNG